MIINCPECDHIVSNMAISCPNCGYPINSVPNNINIENKPNTSIKRERKRRKLPNGFGSIKELKNKRRLKFAAYPPATEYLLTGSAKTPKALGYFQTYSEAYACLSDYNRNIDIPRPDLTKRKSITFEEVYKLLRKNEIDNPVKNLAYNTKKGYTAAYKHCSPLYKMQFCDIKKDDLQKVIDNCNNGYGSLCLIKKLYSVIFKYAIANDITDKNYAPYVTIHQENNIEKGEPFTPDQLRTLWEHKDDDRVKLILILCYTGFRIGELNTLKFNKEERYLQGGNKTKAGKDRIVPINNLIYDFVVSQYYVFNKNYKYYLYHFQKTLKDYGLETANGKIHTLHDCRHTFSWLCDKYEVDTLSKHLLMGHSLGNDVEDNVYGHRTLEELRISINKITN